MEEFGKSDNLYSLLTEYEIKPWETWTIEEKVIHAPGTNIDLSTLTKQSTSYFYSGETKSLEAIHCSYNMHTVRCQVSPITRCLYSGPWLTFEIQLPQDDFHLLAWVLGDRVSPQQLPSLQSSYNLRGLPTSQSLLNGT